MLFRFVTKITKTEPKKMSKDMQALTILHKTGDIVSYFVIISY